MSSKKFAQLWNRTGTPQGSRFAIENPLRTLRRPVQDDLFEVLVRHEPQAIQHIVDQYPQAGCPGAEGNRASLNLSIVR